MKVNVKDLLSAAGDCKMYQVYILTLLSVISGTTDIISLVLGLLELRPDVVTPEGIVPLTYDQCTSNYTLSPNQVGHSYVIIYEVYCNPYYVSLIGIFAFVGVLFANLIIPSFVDKYGRLKCIYYSGFLEGVLYLVYSFTPPKIIYLFVFLFLQGILATFIYLSSYILISESVNKNLRTKYQVLMINFFSVFTVIYTLIFYFVQDIFLIKRFSGLFTIIISIIIYSTVYESPRYYHASGLDKEMEEVFVGIAKFNGNENEYKEYKEKTVHLIKKVDDEKKGKENRKIQDLTFFDLFHEPSVTKTFALMSVVWFAASGFYYGSVVFIKILPGNVYVSSILLAIAESLSNIFTNYIIEVPFLGRKGSYYLLFGIDSILFGMIYFVDLGVVSSSIALTMIRFFSNSLYNIGFIYSIEIYPTVLRATGLNYNSITGRIGIMVNLVLIEILGMNYFLFCFVISLVCIFITHFLKETFQHELKDFIEEDSEAAE